MGSSFRSAISVMPFFEQVKSSGNAHVFIQRGTQFISRVCVWRVLAQEFCLLPQLFRVTASIVLWNRPQSSQVQSFLKSSCTLFMRVPRDIRVSTSVCYVVLHITNRFVRRFLLTYLRSWALPEKLPIVQPFRKFPALLRNPKVHHRVH
jgi:hypothetical protein